MASLVKSELKRYEESDTPTFYFFIDSATIGKSKDQPVTTNQSNFGIILLFACFFRVYQDNLF